MEEDKSPIKSDKETLLEQNDQLWILVQKQRLYISLLKSQIPPQILQEIQERLPELPEFNVDNIDNRILESSHLLDVPIESSTLQFNFMEMQTSIPSLDNLKSMNSAIPLTTTTMSQEDCLSLSNENENLEHENENTSDNQESSVIEEEEEDATDKSDSVPIATLNFPPRLNLPLNTTNPTSSTTNNTSPDQNPEYLSDYLKFMSLDNTSTSMILSRPLSTLVEPTAPMDTQESDLVKHEKQDKEESMVSSTEAPPVIEKDNPSQQVINTIPFIIKIHCIVKVLNQKGKEELAVILSVTRNSFKYFIEKQYLHFASLDSHLKTILNHGISIPEKHLFTSFAPYKSETRRSSIQSYLEFILNFYSKSNLAMNIIESFINSNQVALQEDLQLTQGYLYKRGKTLGVWKAKYYVLHHGILMYSDMKHGSVSGSIDVKHTRVSRLDNPYVQSENENYHAFSITEYKPQNTGTRATTDGNSYVIDMKPVSKHILCCDTDKERDEWVHAICIEILKYRPKDIATLKELSLNPIESLTRKDSIAESLATRLESRNRSSSFPNTSSISTSIKTTPSSVVSVASSNRSSSKEKEGFKPELPPRKVSSVLDNIQESSLLNEKDAGQGLIVLDEKDFVDKDLVDGNVDENVYENVNENINENINEENEDKVDQEDKLKKEIVVQEEKDAQLDAKQLARQAMIYLPPNEESPSLGSLQWKYLKDQIGPLKSISSGSNLQVSKKNRVTATALWNYIKGKEGSSKQTPSLPPRIFGVSIQDAVSISCISDSYPLPAVVYRCIEFLESKRVWEEEGIYRLSGSSTEIVTLKALFEQELDVDLITSLEYSDPHAIAGLLKCYFRELPSSLFTKESKAKLFTDSAHDLQDKQELIQLVKEAVDVLPVYNYLLLKALICHLYKIVMESATNKMSLRNMAIVFSPTLGLPAGMFMLLISEFDSIFCRDVSIELMINKD